MPNSCDLRVTFLNKESAYRICLNGSILNGAFRLLTEPAGDCEVLMNLVRASSDFECKGFKTGEALATHGS